MVFADKEVKAVPIVSGGLDSITMLYLMLSEKAKQDVHPLTFIYGQRHVREALSASYFCNKLGIGNQHKILQLTDLSKLFSKSALVGGQSEHELPEITTPAQRTTAVLKQTVAPFRNGIFLAMAVAHANSIGASEVWYAAHASDYAIYPDCRPEFYVALNQAIWHGTDEPHPTIFAPFCEITKSKIVKLAARLGVEFSKTWSCYAGKALPCKTCPSCIERQNAFNEAGIIDQ